MERFTVIIWLCASLFLCGSLSGGCATRPKKGSPPFFAAVAQRPSLRAWEGERAKVVVMDFDSRVPLQTWGKSQVALDFGKSMKRYLVKGLQQTEQFAVVKNAGTGVLKESDFTPAGYLKRKTLEKIGPLEGAEFLITGAVIAYQLSKESIIAGVEADPFFSEPVVVGAGAPIGLVVKKMFTNLPTAKYDRIAVGLSLIDVTTAKTIDSTLVEGTAQEFGIQNGLFFEEQLLRTSSTFQTPMQKALRVCTMKAVDWIAGTGLAHRRQVALRSSPSRPDPSAVEKLSIQKKSVTVKRSEKDQPSSPRPTRKSDLIEQPMTEGSGEEKPTTGKAAAEKPVAEKLTVEKTEPKKGAPPSEEWGQ